LCKLWLDEEKDCVQFRLHMCKRVTIRFPIISEGRATEIVRGLPSHRMKPLTSNKLSDLYEAKAFEYFWFLPKVPRGISSNPDQSRVAGITHALTGRDEMPEESVVDGLLIRLLEPTMNG
jgi:hypothetical protein